MANKYTKTPAPEKSELEYLYHKKYMSQTEIADHYKVSQKVVWRWFRDLRIKARIPYKRNQKGSKNHSWKGENATYAAFHYRVKSSRGKADKCEKCGRIDKGIKYDWANQTGNYADINDYKMMCRSCHFKKDGHKKNFPNNSYIPNINIRKMIDGK